MNQLTWTHHDDGRWTGSTTDESLVWVVYGVGLLMLDGQVFGDYDTTPQAQHAAQVWTEAAARA
ncbi:hypothetical protein SAMN05421678_108233 [Actinopolymorpha cephalotaxi]|uniref:Uncharacterized protein n=1 Tax=Actinopolymorpha cephalotaxi TaxID=504797 RepID=A0A1I2ULT8_9ACTN|nr:hypothetical protein [Actinopolymorpha cephalotaxi]NYH86647.1 hypothetical protein [Actinopolymorpha cephalotaxi]SFG78013.1 hypothetical protein SAMN05421678_108233 [Actinopolymorpha cephalotaxi]